MSGVVFSAYNWNTLFVGANAVADTMAQKYGRSKEEILTQVLLTCLHARGYYYASASIERRH